ncbi:unnamed protein product [Paramecium pentaurelia]|uniref:Uncharacterized protein n=1 Tax=Paramecium pentaurelia TaxID=43138 RepID=A0A8S1T1R5_9CILI|nr:unnamed protein product [Paramecium pentaurelia]CAD8145409.1 unnamed protein product [Paramecium pentaurelia]
MNCSVFSYYVEQTLPNYVQQKLEECFVQLSNNQNIIMCVDKICEQIEFCRKLCNRLQAQKQIFTLIKLLEHQIYPIKDAEKNNTYLLSLQDVYVFQIILRMLCIMIQFESKKYHDNFDDDYTEKFSNDLVKGFLILRTNQANQLDQQLLEMFLKLKSRSILFYKYLIKWSEQFQLKNCFSSLRKLKLQLKKRQTEQMIEKRRQIDTIKQEYKEECSNSFYEQNDFRIKDKRLQMIMNVKQPKQEQQFISFQDILRQKENTKFINTTESTLSRPSLNKRTINGGINGKYKLGNEIKVLRKTTSSSSKKNNKAEMQPFQILQQQYQLEFCKEVSRKLLKLQQKKQMNWNSEYLAADTESDSCFN